MFPENLLQQIHLNLSYNCCFELPGLPPWVWVAQWEQREKNEQPVAPQPELTIVFQAEQANPRRVILAWFTGADVRIPVVLAEINRGSPAVYAAEAALALALAEHGLVIVPVDETPAKRYPDPLALVQAGAGQARLLWRGMPEAKGEEAARWFDSLAADTLDARFQPWIDRLRRWETDASKLARVHLVSLRSNLAHELGWGFGQRLLAWGNRFRSTSKLRSHLRLLYLEIEKSWRRSLTKMGRP